MIMSPALRLTVAWLLCGALQTLALVRLFEDGLAGTIFNSDALYLHLFAQDLLTGVPIGGWRPPPANCLFPDLLFVYPAVAFARFFELEPAWAVFASSLALGLAWTAAYAWFFGVLSRRDSCFRPDAAARLQLAAPLGSCAICAALVFGLAPDALEPLWVPSFHAGAALFLPIVLGLVLIALDPRRPRRESRSAPLSLAALILALALLLSLLFASDRIVLVAVVLPALAGMAFRMSSGAAWPGLRIWLVCAAILILAYLLGEAFLRGLDRVLVVNRLELDFALLWTPEFRRALAALPGEIQIGLRPVSVLFFAALAALIAAWFRTRTMLESRGRILRFVIVAHLALILLLFAAMIPVGYMSGRILLVERYIAPALAFPVFAACFCWLALGLSKRAVATAAACLLLFTVVGGVVFADSARDSLMRISRAGDIFARQMLRPREQADAGFSAITCMRRNADRLGRFGLAAYWPAKQLSFLGAGDFQVNQVQAQLELMHWVNNFEWYRAPHRSVGYSFIVANGLDRDRIVRLYGTPAQRIQCADLELWTFQNPALNQAFPPALLDFALRALGRERN